MGTTTDKLNKIIVSKEDIRLAINEKGVLVDTSVLLSDYGNKVREISTGLPTQEKTLSLTENASFEILPDSGFALSKVTANVNVPSIVGTGNIRARFYCCDGTIIKYQRLNKGETPIEPIVQIPDSRLVFSGWNKTIGAIFEDTEYGAIFNTVDGATYVQLNTINPTLDATITANFTFTKIANSTLTVEWGDGTTSTDTTANTSVTLTKTYASGQVFWMRITCNNTFSLGGSGVPFCSNATFVRKCYFGANILNILSNSFTNNISLEVLSIPVGVQLVQSNAFVGTSSLRHVNYPTTITDWSTSVFQSSLLKMLIFGKNNPTLFSNTNSTYFYFARALQKISIPDGTTEIAGGFFRECNSLEEVIIPATVSIFSGTLHFLMCFSLKLLKIKRATPPIISNSTFLDMNNTCRIEVPQGSLNAYRTAPNWSVRAGQIFEEE